jgi:lipoprotein-releasing system permease protein
VRSVDGKFSGAVARGQTLLEINEMLSRIRRSQKSLKPHEFLDLRAQEVVLTDSLARSLRAYPGEDLLIMPPESLTLPPGEAPIVERVRVRATVGVDVGEYANAGIFFEDGVTLQRLKKSRSREEGIEVRFFNPVMAEDVKSYLLRKEKLENKKVTTWVEANKAMFFALKMEKVAMGSLLSLAVLVTSFGIILLVTLLIIEKQKDIGLFQALGLSFNDTKKLFARLGLWLSSVGLFGGFFFGILVSIILKAVPLPDFPEIYTVRDLPVEFDLKQLGFLAIGLSALTVMAAYLPVRRAMQLTPAEALKGNVRDLKKLDV